MTDFAYFPRLGESDPYMIIILWCSSMFSGLAPLCDDSAIWWYDNPHTYENMIFLNVSGLAPLHDDMITPIYMRTWSSYCDISLCFQGLPCQARTLLPGITSSSPVSSGSSFFPHGDYYWLSEIRTNYPPWWLLSEIWKNYYSSPMVIIIINEKKLYSLSFCLK